MHVTMSRWNCLVWSALLVASSLVAAPVAAQLTPADSAAVLLRAAEDFELEGESEIATALYNHITERFPDTPAAIEAAAPTDRGR